MFICVYKVKYLQGAINMGAIGRIEKNTLWYKIITLLSVLIIIPATHKATYIVYYVLYITKYCSIQYYDITDEAFIWQI